MHRTNVLRVASSSAQKTANVLFSQMQQAYAATVCVLVIVRVMLMPICAGRHVWFLEEAVLDIVIKRLENVFAKNNCSSKTFTTKLVRYSTNRMDKIYCTLYSIFAS